MVRERCLTSEGDSDLLATAGEPDLFTGGEVERFPTGDSDRLLRLASPGGMLLQNWLVIFPQLSSQHTSFLLSCSIQIDL